MSQTSPNPLRVVSLYSGAGGLDQGFIDAGFEIIYANDFDAHAVASYTRNIGDHAVCGSIEEQIWPEPGSADVVIGGPPCFAAGTMILTKKWGYRPIKELTVGDEVLTHRGRWRAVTQIMSRRAQSTRLLRAQGCTPIITTDEHPFYARTRTVTWDNEHKRRTREFTEPKWVKAADLKLVKGPAPNSQPQTPFLGQTLPPVTSNHRLEDEWWLIGRWLADGWLRKDPAKKRQTIWLCCAHAEAAMLEEKLLHLYPPNKFTKVKEQTVVKFNIRDHSLYDFLIPFGHGAANKSIPGHLMSLDKASARALLEGYYSGEGSFNPKQGGILKVTTLSKALALSVALLAQRAYGVVATIVKIEVPPTTIIEGRIVNQKTQYQCSIPTRNRSAFIKGDWGWKLLRKNEVTGPAEVWNISVAEDESYMADGCIVHNCQGFSVSGKMDPHDPRSRHVFVFFDVIEHIQPRAFIMENVKNLATNSRFELIRQALFERAHDLGYTTELYLLNASHFGVPQARERMFLVGIKEGVPVAPKPTTQKSPPSVRLTLATLPPLGAPGNDGVCTAIITPAKLPVLRRSPFAGMLFNGQGRPLDLEAPALTLPATMGGNRTPIIDQQTLEDGSEPWVVDYHRRLWAGEPPVTKIPPRLRRLSVQEAMALQTFPSTWTLAGSQSSQYHQIGNAVPTRLGYHVALSLLAALER